jgi:GxxExxY protein
MHLLFSKADALSGNVIEAAMEVHRDKGPGLLESIYERCLMHELALRRLPATNLNLVRIRYKDLVFDEPLRFDMPVDDCLLVETKSVERILPIHKAQLLSYMKLLNVPLGLLMNFHAVVLKDGSTRLILPGAHLL